MSDQIEVIANIIELKKVADGKVTIIVTDDERTPNISFFTQTFDGVPLYDYLKVGQKCKITYYKKDEYFNLLHAEVLEQKEYPKTIQLTKEPSTNDMIIRQSSVKASADIINTKYLNKSVEGQDLTKETIESARIIEGYIHNG